MAPARRAAIHCNARRLSALALACLLRRDVDFGAPRLRPVRRERARGRLAAEGRPDAPEGAAAPAEAMKDYTAEATSLLNGMRTPAAFIAGAAFGGAFGLPLAPEDGLVVGLAKRCYVVAACAALCAELSTVVASTIAINKLSRTTSGVERLHPSPSALLHSELELEWVSSQFNFLTGLVLFSGTVAARAWLSIKCPVLAKAVACMIVSSSAFMCSLINDEFEDYGNAALLGRRYARLLVLRVARGPGLLKICSLGFAVLAAYYFAYAAFHIGKLILSRA